MANKVGELYESLGSTQATMLFAGIEVVPVAAGITLTKGFGILEPGTVLGKITASGLCAPLDSTKADGTEKPYAILAEQIDTTGNFEYPATAYLTGVFNGKALAFRGTDTIDKFADAMRAIGLLTKPTEAY